MAARLGSQSPLAPACFGTGLAGRAHAVRAARGPNTAASHIHAFVARPRLSAIRPAINIDTMNTMTVMLAAIMLQAPPWLLVIL
jgi:hypothetical protein